MTYRNYEVHGPLSVPTLQREHLGHLVIVQTFGSYLGSWGFTIWRDGRCLTGGMNWNWTRDDAIDQADRALASLLPDPEVSDP